jgi:catechol 2,3-dioxygenase-like lactoylglutathione lyase family enzyme
MASTLTSKGPATRAAASLPVSPFGLDHANLHVRDLESSLQFYAEVLGLDEPHIMSRDDAGRPTFAALPVGRQTIFLYQNKGYVPPASSRDRGLNHICLLIEPNDPEALMATLRERGVHIRNTRKGQNADGKPTYSIYVDDPDGHGIELEQVVS